MRAELTRVRTMVEAHAFDEEGGSTRFIARLAREQGFGRARAERVMHEYRRFLVIALACGHGVSPPRDVDEAWHLHILHTRAYARFCDDVAGRFLHHTPARGPIDHPPLRELFRATLASYRAIFGDEPPRAIWQPPRTQWGRLLARLATPSAR